MDDTSHRRRLATNAYDAGEEGDVTECITNVNRIMGNPAYMVLIFDRYLQICSILNEAHYRRR